MTECDQELLWERFFLQLLGLSKRERRYIKEINKDLQTNDVYECKYDPDLYAVRGPQRASISTLKATPRH